MANRKFTKYPVMAATSDRAYLVTFGYDHGGPESGPRISTGTDIVYAKSEEEACRIWEEENVRYGDGYAGCSASLASAEEIQQYEDDIREAEAEYEWLRSRGWI